MPSKLSNEYVKKVIESFGCKLIGEYINATEKLIIQCPCSKKYKISFNQFTDKRNSHVCPQCARKNGGEKRKNNSEILFKKLQNFGFWFDANGYVNTRSKIKIVDNLGFAYYLSVHYFMESIKEDVIFDKFGVRNPFTKDNIKNWIKINNKEYNLLDVYFENSGIFVKLKCNICNREWVSLFSNILNRNGCPNCARKKLYLNKNNNIEKLFPYLMEEWDYSKNNISPTRYSCGSNEYIWWRCKQCGNNWKAKIRDRTKSGSGCPICKMSGGAKKIYYWLQNNKYDFEIEYKFDDLLSDIGVPLRYDFCVFNVCNENILIEFDGKQHDKFVPMFHKDQNAFEQRKKYDNLKNEYAKNNSIKLIRISYKYFDFIEDILTKNL